MKFRISLKTTMALFTAATLFCGWRMFPPKHAAAFQAAIQRNDLAAADRLVVSRTAPTMNAGRLAALPATFVAWRDQQPRIEFQIVVYRQSASDWLCGRSHGSVTVKLPGGSEGVAPFIATASGVAIAEFQLLFGGSGFSIANR